MPDTIENEVFEAVKKEVKEIGATSKKNFEDINKNYEEIKKLVDESEKNNDILITEKIKKFSEDLLTRQEAADKENAKVHERMDELEVAMKNRPVFTGEDGKDEMANAIQLKQSHMAVHNQPLGLKELEPNLEDYRMYVKSFPAWMRAKKEQLLPDEYIKAMLVGVDPDGGYLVTPQMSSRIVERQYESDPVRQLASNETISTDALEMLVDYDEADADWEGETVANDETDTPQLNKKRIPAHVVSARPRATQTLLDDAGVNVENWLSGKVANKFMRTEAAAFVDGDGVGKPRGFLTYSNYTTAGVDEWGRIEQINMRAAAALTTDGLLDVKYSLVEYYLTRGTWLMNRLTVSEAMKLKDGDGQYIWRPGLQEGQPSLLLGLPLRMATTMPTVAAGTLPVALADWAEAYMVVDRMGITVQRDPYTVKPFVEFYTRKRVGGDVINFQAIKIGVVAA
jgi:HK97 family phage major capsid protein